MNRHVLIGLVISGAALTAGIVLNDQHYRLNVPYQPADQTVIAHRDSPYTGMTWIESVSNNYRQLRFFDRVEGGVCLRPSWAELVDIAGLEHLRPTAPIIPVGMGTLNNSPYISFFPAGILLNRVVPAAPRVLVVGLGSGVGIAQLAHHFPQSAVEVVDIDPAVIAMVREHYPLLAWLETQRTAAGLPRVTFVAADARAHIRSRRGAGFHMVILDAYTAGSTIPPHLMTREFFAQAGDTLCDGGVVLANVIGCYGQPTGDNAVKGQAHRVLGGAVRSIRAAGLPHAWCVPVLREWEEPSSFRLDHARNTIVIAAKHELAPRRFAAGWERLQAWRPFPELAVGRYVSRHIALADREGRILSTYVPLDWIDQAVPQLTASMKAASPPESAPRHTITTSTSDRNVVDAVVAAAKAHGGDLIGWGNVPSDAQIQFRVIDWTLFPRETWRASFAFARDGSRHDPDALVGPVDGPERDAAPPSWHMLDAPLFTDQTPNADIMNH